MPNTILALDLASQFGWAEGAPGETPRFGSKRFAPAGAEPEDVFAGAIREMTPRLAAFPPRVLVFETPSLFQLRDGKSNPRTVEVLFGLPAIIQGLARHFRVPIIRKASANSVRKHFIGNGRMPRAQAKKAVVAECRRRGWNVRNDDEGDACALWDYAASIIQSPGQNPPVDINQGHDLSVGGLTPIA